jgi:hypothetical protein
MPFWCGQGQLYFFIFLLICWRTQHDARSFMIFTRHQILLGLSIQEDEMGRTGGWYERGVRCIQGFGGETWGKEAYMG